MFYFFPLVHDAKKHESMSITEKMHLMVKDAITMLWKNVYQNNMNKQIKDCYQNA
jgi:hypothetical protein